MIHSLCKTDRQVQLLQSPQGMTSDVTSCTGWEFYLSPILKKKPAVRSSLQFLIVSPFICQINNKFCYFGPCDWHIDNNKFTVRDVWAGTLHHIPADMVRCWSAGEPDMRRRHVCKAPRTLYSIVGYGYICSQECSVCVKCSIFFWHHGCVAVRRRKKRRHNPKDALNGRWGKPLTCCLIAQYKNAPISWAFFQS